MLLALLGGVGLFLLGMILLTEGLKAAAGSSMRRLLMRGVRGPVSGMVAGTVTTAAVQSSSATTLMTIGFVSAGLLTLPGAIGVVLGANLGTTSTGWIVSALGFKVSLGGASLPIVLVGALLRLLGRGRIAALGLALAGFGLVFLGIEGMKDGMAHLAEGFDPGSLPGDGFTGRLLLVGVGIVMTILTQSSSAAMATTLAALAGGALDLERAAALIVGQNIGTTTTALFASVGASVPARRTAAAHILFNALTGIAALLALSPLVALAERIAGSGVVALAAFHTIFNLLGVILVLPLARPFARLLCRVVPEREPDLARHLDRSVTATGAVALEAGRRCAAGLLGVLAAIAAEELAAKPIPRTRAARLDSVEQTLERLRDFLGRVAREGQDPEEVVRHAALLHGADHVDQLLGVLREPPCTERRLAHRIVRPIADALEPLLGMTSGWCAAPIEPPPLDAMEAASTGIAALRKARRGDVLAAVAAGSESPDAAEEIVMTIRRLDRIGYHLWRAAGDLRPDPPSPVAAA